MEAKNYDFSIAGDDFLIGNIEFGTAVFYCEQCEKNYEINEIRGIEKKNKKMK